MILELDEAIKRFINNAEYERTHGNLQGCIEFRQLAEWLKELKRLRGQTMWIPVSEGLPKEGEVVFITILWKDGRTTVEKSWLRDVTYWQYFGRDVNVIAWMPLLEPYKAESEDKE